jgi:nucleoside-diphosphate-sugar epimerase
LKKIVATGATGAIGDAVLQAVSKAFPEAQIVKISRRPVQVESARGFVLCDLQDESPAASELLGSIVEGADAILHMAADVRWSLELDAALSANVETTRRILALTEQHAAKSCRFIYFSTAFAAAPPRREIAMFSEQGGHSFANTYEYTKRLAETEVQKSELAWTILRPSLVVGSTIDGSIGRYHGIYNLLSFGAKGCIPLLPGFADSAVDFIPVDYLADATVKALTCSSAIGKVVPLVSGASSLTVSQAVNEAFTVINTYRRNAGSAEFSIPTIVSPNSYRRFYYPFLCNEMKPSVAALFENLRAYLPYFALSKPFDHDTDDRPDPRNYFGRVIQHWCVKNHEQVTGPLFDWNKACRRPSSDLVTAQQG